MSAVNCPIRAHRPSGSGILQEALVYRHIPGRARRGSQARPTIERFPDAPLGHAHWPVRVSAATARPYHRHRCRVLPYRGSDEAGAGQDERDPRPRGPPHRRPQFHGLLEPLQEGKALWDELVEFWRTDSFDRKRWNGRPSPDGIAMCQGGGVVKATTKKKASTPSLTERPQSLPSADSRREGLINRPGRRAANAARLPCLAS